MIASQWALVLLALQGCYAFPCGSYALQTGGVFDRALGRLSSGDPQADANLVDIDGTYHEQCGRDFGTTGRWDPDGDGLARIDFAVTRRALTRGGHISPIVLQLSVPNERLYPGETATIADLSGLAELLDDTGAYQASASLVDATLEVLDGKGYQDPCQLDATGFLAGPGFTLRWDLRWSDGADVQYTAQGRDKIVFDTFDAPQCQGG